MESFMNRKDMHKYDDIIDVPHPVSRTHPQMPLSDRAAQFAPFAALTGHYEAVKETARLTDERAKLHEDVEEALDRQLRYIEKHLHEQAVVSVTHFVPDLKKRGGSYVTAEGQVKRIDTCEETVLLTDGTRIPIHNIIRLEQL